jgi:hypothetical protein
MLTSPGSSVIPPQDGNALRWSAVELGPPLPMAVFTSSEFWRAERIGALALYCSDGRWGEAFDEFCHKHLHMPRYDRLAVAGGPALLMRHDSGDDHLFQTVRAQLDFLVRAHELQRIVLITHYGCAFYAEKLHQPPDACLPVQVEDTIQAAETLQLWYPGVRVETYLAMRRITCLSFHEVSANPGSLTRPSVS